MQRYELTFITRSEENDGGVSDLIAQLAGLIESRSMPTRRKLAYPIKKETGGVYYTYLFEIDPTNLPTLNQKLQRNEEILRHLIIVDGIRKPLEIVTKLKEKDLEIPTSLTEGMAELAAEAALTDATPTVPSEELSTDAKISADEPAAPKSEKKEISAEELTAEERKKKLDEKLKSILG